MAFLDYYFERLRRSFDPVWITIMFLIVGPFLMVWGGVNFITQKQFTDKCSSETYGKVVNVETEYDDRNRAYVATIEPIDSSIFSTSTIVSDSSSHAYEKGEYVLINYDPSDSSTYYIEYDSSAASYTYLIIAGVVISFFGLAFLLIGRKVMK